MGRNPLYLRPHKFFIFGSKNKAQIKLTGTLSLFCIYNNVGEHPNVHLYAHLQVCRHMYV